MTGKFTFIGKCISYPLPFSTQYTNPQKLQCYGGTGITTLPQCDPSGLFYPPSSEASWVILINSKTGKPGPMYSEPRMIVVPWPMDNELVLNSKMNPNNEK